MEVSQYFSVRANYEGIYVEIDSLNTESYTDTLTYFGSTDLSTDSHLLEVIKIDGTETYGIPTKDKKNTAAF